MVVSNKTVSAFNLGNLYLQIEFDGVLCSSPYQFADLPFFSIKQTADSINEWIKTSYRGPHTQDGLLPRAFVNHEGRLAIYAADSVVIQDSPSGAEDELGFSSDNSSDANGLLRIFITTGILANTQEYYYDENNNLTNIYYTLTDSSIKSTNITYGSDGNVLKVEGE